MVEKASISDRVGTPEWWRVGKYSLGTREKGVRKGIQLEKRYKNGKSVSHPEMPTICFYDKLDVGYVAKHPEIPHHNFVVRERMEPPSQMIYYSRDRDKTAIVAPESDIEPDYDVEKMDEGEVGAEFAKDHPGVLKDADLVGRMTGGRGNGFVAGTYAMVDPEGVLHLFGAESGGTCIGELSELLREERIEDIVEAYEENLQEGVNLRERYFGEEQEREIRDVQFEQFTHRDFMNTVDRLFGTWKESEEI